MKKNRYAFLPLLIILAAAIAVTSLIAGLKTPATATAAGSQYPTIVLDAGHGGVDGGATSASGAMEKDINLAVTLNLRQMLQTAGFRVVLTRDADVSTHDPGCDSIREIKVSDLHNRLKLVQDTPDCILVSVHQNHFTESKYSGAQFFYSKNNELSKRLADMFKTDFQTMLQPKNEREIKPAGKDIYLMWNATVPAVLAECGFLSNPDEAALLITPEYQRKVAYVLFCGIVDFCNEVYA